MGGALHYAQCPRGYCYFSLFSSPFSHFFSPSCLFSLPYLSYSFLSYLNSHSRSHLISETRASWSPEQRENEQINTGK